MLFRTKIKLKVNKSEPNIQCSHETLNLNNSLKKTKFKKNLYFRVLRWTSFSLIPLTVLNDKNIDRPKLFEQKNPFVYIVPPTTSGVGTVMILDSAGILDS